MIPKEAFAALTALMLSAWAFGVACDRLLSAWMQGRTDGSEDSTEADHERWEDDPEPTMPCVGCPDENTSMFDDPCISCERFWR